MLFNSWTFVVFIIPVLGSYYLLPFRWQNRMLLVASCIFYATWDWRFLFLLAGTTSIDYFVALRIRATESLATRKWLVGISCGMNLLVLAFFKYFNFFIQSASALLVAAGLDVPSYVLEVALPVGISFYTFHAMSYAIDVFRGKLEPIHSYPDYMLFVLYFPQLVAGPIARAALLIPQVTHARKILPDQVVSGLWLCLWGFFKKMAIADNLAPLADVAFEGPAPSGARCLLAIYAFAFQIYCDFSGYTDIARGLAKLMGFELSLNFRLPYMARNPADFWHRWHISLSTWLRDYLYIPLGGNRGGPLLTYRNLMITMLLGGLWHGAAWNFVIWGAYHGFLLSAHRLWSGPPPRDGFPPIRAWLRVIQIAVMFHLTCLGWLFFRATSFGQIVTFLQQIAFQFHFDRAASEMIFPLLLFPGMLLTLELWLQNADDPRARPGWNFGLGAATVAGLILTLVYLSARSGKQFLYFQF